DNSAGGGIYNTGTATVQNSTISGNRTSGNGGGIGNFNNDTLLTVQNSTITQNRSDNPGGGISNYKASTLLHNTIVVNNFEGTGEDDLYFGSGPVDANSSNNLIGTGASSGLTDGVNGNQVGVADPK